MSKTLLKGGRLVDPASRTDTRADVLVDDGRVAEVGSGLDAGRAEVVDCDGLVVCPRPGLDGLGVLAARLAQVHVQVDQAGADDQPVAVHDLGPGRVQARPDPGDPAVVDQHVGGPVMAGRRVDQPPPLEQQLGHAATSGPPRRR